MAYFNKRKQKEWQKQLGESIEKKQQRWMYEQEMGVRRHHHMRTMSHQYPVNRFPKFYPKQLADSKSNEHSVERVALQKLHSDIAIPSRPIEDHGPSFEDAELKSTGISCQERQSIKDIPIRNYGSSPEPHVENPVSEGRISSDSIYHHWKQNSGNGNFPHEKSLLDDLFEKDKKELEEYCPEYS